MPMPARNLPEDMRNLPFASRKSASGVAVCWAVPFLPAGCTVRASFAFPHHPMVVRSQRLAA